MGVEKKSPFYVKIAPDIYRGIKADADARGWTLTTWFNRLIAEERPDLAKAGTEKPRGA